MPRLVSLEVRRAVWADIVADLPISQIASKHAVSREFVRKYKMRQLTYEKLNPNFYRITLAVEFFGLQKQRKCPYFKSTGLCDGWNYYPTDVAALPPHVSSALHFAECGCRGLPGHLHLTAFPELCAVCHKQLIGEVQGMLLKYAPRVI